MSAAGAMKVEKGTTIILKTSPWMVIVVYHMEFEVSIDAKISSKLFTFFSNINGTQMIVILTDMTFT